MAAAPAIDADPEATPATGPVPDGTDVAPPWLLWCSRAVLLVSLVVWVSSLHRMKVAPVSEYGLLDSGGPGLSIAALGIAVAFVLAVRARSTADCITAILGFVAVTRATASIIVDLPIYSWTYKHIGVIDHLSSTGHLARNVDIYNNWPGFFSIAAWFSDVTGVSFEDVALWFPVVADLAIVLAMFTVSRAFGHSIQVALVAAFGIQTFNWVAQDYYSPQATAFIMALTCLAMLLRSKTHPKAAWLTVPLFVAITVTHQLTPFWICGIAFLLGVTKRIRPRWIFLVYIGIAIAFAAANLKALTPYGLLTGFDPLANAQTNVPTAGNAGRAFTSLAAKGTSGLMWLSAALCAYRARKRREPVWAPAVLAFTSFGLLAGQSYGGEAIFRVFLYSMPGCLLLISPVVHRAIVRDLGATRAVVVHLRRVVVAGAAVVAIMGGLQAYYGTWFINVVNRSGLDAVTNFLDTAPTNSLEVPLLLGVAERPTGRYADFARNDASFDDPLIQSPDILQTSFQPAEMQTITATLTNENRPVYVFVTEEMRRYSDYYGLFPPGAIDRFVHWLSTSSAWTTVENTSQVSIFRLDRP